MRPLLLLCLAAGLNTAALGQSTEFPLLSLKYNPTALLHPQTPTMQFAVEIRPFRRWSLELAYGARLPGTRVEKLGHLEHQKFVKWRGAVHGYLYTAQRFHMYLAAETFFIPRSYTLHNQYFKSAKDGQTYSYTSSNITHNVWGMALKNGCLIRLEDWLWLEMYGGLGFRTRNVKHRPVDPVLMLDQPFSEWLGPGPEAREGKRTIPHLTIGAKLVVGLWQRK